MPPLDDVLTRATADPAVLGVILTGSHARGLATEHSDYDLTVVLTTHSDAWPRERTRTLDIAPVTADQLADTSVRWPRYGFRDAKVLLDRGGVAALVARQATPTADEAREWAREALDAVAPASVADHPVELFPAVAALARTHGHTDVLDQWGPDIDLIDLQASAELRSSGTMTAYPDSTGSPSR